MLWNILAGFGWARPRLGLGARPGNGPGRIAKYNEKQKNPSRLKHPALQGGGTRCCSLGGLSPAPRVPVGAPRRDTRGTGGRGSPGMAGFDFRILLETSAGILASQTPALGGGPRCGGVRRRGAAPRPHCPLCVRCLLSRAGLRGVRVGRGGRTEPRREPQRCGGIPDPRGEGVGTACAPRGAGENQMLSLTPGKGEKKKIAVKNWCLMDTRCSSPSPHSSPPTHVTGGRGERSPDGSPQLSPSRAAERGRPAAPAPHESGPCAGAPGGAGPGLY